MLGLKGNLLLSAGTPIEPWDPRKRLMKLFSRIGTSETPRMDTEKFKYSWILIETYAIVCKRHNDSKYLADELISIA